MRNSGIEPSSVILNELDRKRYLNDLYHVCVFPANRKQKIALTLIGWDIFDVVFELNPMKLDAKQDHNVLFKHVFFWPEWKTKMAIPIISPDIVDFHFKQLYREKWKYLTRSYD